MAFNLVSAHKASVYTVSKHPGTETGFPKLQSGTIGATPLLLHDSPLALPLHHSPPHTPVPSNLLQPNVTPHQALPGARVCSPRSGSPAPRAVPSAAPGPRGALTSSRVQPPRLPLPPRPPLPSSRPAPDAVFPGREPAARTGGLAPRLRTSEARGAPGCRRSGGGGRKTRYGSSSWISRAWPPQS